MTEFDWTAFVFILSGLTAGLGITALLQWSRARRLEAELAETRERAAAIEDELHELRTGSARQEAELQTRLEAAERELEALRRELGERDLALEARQRELGELKAAHAELGERIQQERKATAEKLAILEEARERLGDAFKALSAEALKASSESFLKVAEETLKRFQESARGDLEKRQQAIEQLTRPIRERLERFDGKLDELEKARHGAYRALDTQLRALVETHLPRLHRETADLVKALRQPQGRGRWGELQLRRVVEMAGMLEHCDFEEQASRTTEEGRLRPDLVVRLPGGRTLVVDAKAPVEAYLEAVEARSEEERSAALARHARQVRTHIQQLAKKSYFEQFEASPEFVVLFVPGEAFFSAALAQDPGLIEYGAESRVIPASPTTLIALLKAVAYGWRQEALARNAAEIAALGRELYDRIGKLAGAWADVGRRLRHTVDAYNRSVGTLERRVLPSARRFRELKTVAADAEIGTPAPLTEEPRPLTAAELVEHTADDGEDEPGRKS